MTTMNETLNEKLSRVFSKQDQFSPTLSVTVHLLVQCKLAGIVQNHELLQQTLDDFSSGGNRTDVELLHAVRGQVEGCSLIGPFTICSLLAL